MDRPMPRQFQAVIEKKEQLTNKIILVTFKLVNPPEIHFIPGQTISLNVGAGLNRAMSIASPPSDKTHILMCHDVSPGGPGSQWTIHHNVGDAATFMAPLGIFILDRGSRRKKVFVATGTGIAPFRSMLLYHLADGMTDEVIVYWGLRFEEDVYWAREFEELCAKHRNVHFILTLSKPTDAWQESASRRRGRVTDHVIQEEQNLPDSDFYLCGNQAMIKDMEEQLLSHGVPKEQIFRELYF